jgi:dsDNA-specific endonuclease/ATPase MutS2
MSASFKIGDQVRFLTEEGEAIVLKISAEEAEVRDEHGFEYVYPLTQLVPVKKIQIKGEIRDKEVQAIQSKASKKNQDFPRLDLHIENLVKQDRDLSSHQKFTIQIQHFKRFLIWNEEQKNARFLVVHGVGSGKLKTEIQEIVRGLPGATMYDANFSQN